MSQKEEKAIQTFFDEVSILAADANKEASDIIKRISFKKEGTLMSHQRSITITKDACLVAKKA